MATAIHSDVVGQSVALTSACGSHSAASPEADEAQLGARFFKGVFIALGLSAPVWIFVGWAIRRFLE